MTSDERSTISRVDVWCWPECGSTRSRPWCGGWRRSSSPRPRHQRDSHRDPGRAGQDSPTALTWATITALNALPSIVAVLLALTDLGPGPGTGPPFLTDGTLFPLATLGLVLPLLLSVAVALVCGDAIAGEVQSDTLRYLLVRPVAPALLLVAKLVSVVACVALATLVVALVTYVVLAMLGVAAIALLLSTMTDSAAAPALGTTGFLVASTVLLGLNAADSIKPHLVTRHWLAFFDPFGDPIRWRDVIDGVLAQLAYLLVFA